MNKPQKRTRRISGLVTEELFTAVKRAASKDQRLLSRIVEFALEDFLLKNPAYMAQQVDIPEMENLIVVDFARRERVLTARL